MNSLADMNARRQQWMDEKPQFDFGSELRVGEGDVVIFHFVSSGDDGDRFIKVYKAHKVATVAKSGRPMTVAKYCPRMSGETEVECAYCAQGNEDFSERMSIWMDVSVILRKVLPDKKTLPQVQFEGSVYFKEDINDYRVWHTSAWRESPWADIVKLANMYKGLNNFQAQLAVHGKELQRRFKLYAIPQSETLSAERYKLAHEKCEPILSLLKAQMGSPVTANPNSTVAANTPVNSVPSGVEAWSPAGSNIPTISFNNVAAPAPQTPTAADSTESIPTAIEEDTRRPLREMF